MAIMAMDTQTKKVVSSCLFILLNFEAIAGDLKIIPTVELKETYSNNITLTNNEQKDALVSETGVNINATYNAQNTSAQLNSTSTYAFYSHDHNLNTAYHTLNASGKTQLWRSGIALSGSASIKNVDKNSARSGIANIIHSNTVQLKNYRAGLSYQINNSQHNLYSAVNFSTHKAEDKIGNNDSTHFILSSKNGIGARQYFWDFNGSANNRESDRFDSKQHTVEAKIGYITPYKFTPFIRYYDENNSGNINSNNALKTNSYGVGFRWQPIARLYIDLSYNQPSDDSLDNNNEKQGNFFDTTINWQPTLRTQLQATHSQRFFGDSYSLNVKHQNKRLSNEITYDEQVQSFTRENYQLVINTDNTLNPIELELIEDNNYWLNKTARWTSSLILPRTTFSFNLTHSTRENLNSARENETKKADINIIRKIGANHKVALSAYYAEHIFNKNTIEDNQIDQYRRYQLSFDKKLSSSLYADISVAYHDRTSNDERYNYDETRISARLTKDF